MDKEDPVEVASQGTESGEEREEQCFYDTFFVTNHD